MLTSHDDDDDGDDGDDDDVTVAASGQTDAHCWRLVCSRLLSVSCSLQPLWIVINSH